MSLQCLEAAEETIYRMYCANRELGIKPENLYQVFGEADAQFMEQRYQRERREA
jgi:hypothetical protein